MKESNEIIKDLTSGEKLSQEYSGYQTIWDASEQFEYPEQNTDAAWNSFKNKISTPKARVFSIRKFAVAASLTLLLAFGAILFYNNLNSVPNTILYVGEGNNVRTIELADGSIITLNINSNLETDEDFGTKHRNVSISGEVYFNVKSNELPFVVKTNKLLTKVTGTQFNIDFFDKSKTKVALNEGSVELIIDKHQPVSIKPGELAIVNQNSSELQITSFSPNNLNAWMSNKLVFENTPLIEVIERLELVLNVTFKYPSHLNNTLLSTTIPSLNADVAAKILSETLEAEFSYTAK